MRITRGILSLTVAVAASGGALGSALALGRALRVRAAVTSHQEPTEDRWTEPAIATTPALVKEGRSLFLASCAHCHGADGSGDEGPDLHDLRVSDRYIAHMITFGEPHEMPSFARKHGAADITALTAYLRSLKGNAD